MPARQVLLDGPVSARDIEAYRELPEILADEIVFGLWDELGVPADVQQDPNWTRGETEQVANQFAKNYFFSLIAVTEYGVRNAEELDLLLNGGATGMEYQNGIPQFESVPGFLELNAGPVDLVELSDTRIRVDVDSHNIALSTLSHGRSDLSSGVFPEIWENEALLWQEVADFGTLYGSMFR